MACLSCGCESCECGDDLFTPYSLNDTENDQRWIRICQNLTAINQLLEGIRCDFNTILHPPNAELQAKLIESLQLLGLNSQLMLESAAADWTVIINTDDNNLNKGDPT